MVFPLEGDTQGEYRSSGSNLAPPLWKRPASATRIVGATYFPDKLNRIFAKFFEDAGFKVRGMAGIDVPFNKVQELSGEQVYAHIKRNFLKTLAAGYTAGALGYPVNETIRIGCIGTGGRAQMLMRKLDLRPIRLLAPSLPARFRRYILFRHAKAL